MDSVELSEWVVYFIIKAEPPEETTETLEVKMKSEFEMYNMGVK